MSRNFSTLYVFGSFRLAPTERQLWRGGECVHLTPKAFDLLVLLLESAGHLQSRDELIARLWGDTVVEEHGLTWNISTLRRALGDGGDSPTYIETVRGHGYRFIAPVRTETAPEPAHVWTGTSATPPSTGATDRSAGSPPSPVRGGPRHAWWWWAPGLAVVLAAIALFLVRHVASGPENSASGTSARPTIAIVGFRNLSHDHDYDWIGDALTEMLGTELAAGHTANLSPASDVMRALHDQKLDASAMVPTAIQMERLRQVLGANASISGAYLRQDGSGSQRIRVDVHLQLQDRDAHETSITITATGDDLFALVSRLGRQLRGKLGMARLNSAQQGEFMASMPTNTDAAADYASGLSALASGQTLLARTLLQQAVRQEPDFPLAHSALARVWLDLGDNRNAALEAQLALRHSAGLSYAQRQLLLGLQAEADHQWPQAIDAYRRLFDANPDSLNYGLMLARAQDKAGQYDDVRDTLDQLRKLPPPFGNDPRVMLASANLHADLSEYEAYYADAMRAAARANQLGQDAMQAHALSDAAHARMQQNAFEDALALADKARKLFADSDADSLDAGINLQRIGIAYDGLGRYDDAIAAYEDANELFAGIGNRYWQAASMNNIAGVYFRRDRLQQAQHSYEQALALFRELHRDAAVAVVLNNLSTVVGGLGHLDQAIEYEKQSLAIRRKLGAPRSIASTLFNLGSESFALGRLDEAGNYLRESRDIYLDQHAESDASDAVSALADLARVRDRLDEARQGYEQALAMRQRQHVETSVAWSQRDLAELDLDTGHPARALRRANAALPVFLKAGASTDAIAARADIALALARLGRLAEARQQTRILDSRIASVSDQATLLGLKIARAAIAHRLGNGARAEQLLAQALQQATQMKMKSRSYPIRLEQLRLQADHGPGNALRAQAAALVHDARQDGFLFVADRAQAIMNHAARRTALAAPHAI